MTMVTNFTIFLYAIISNKELFNAIFLQTSHENENLLIKLSCFIEIIMKKFLNANYVFRD